MHTIWDYKYGPNISFWGIELKQTNEEIFISQKKYAIDILNKVKFEVCTTMLNLSIQLILDIILFMELNP